MNKQKLTSYLESSEQAIHWLKSKMDEDGSYGLSNTDLACYYKSPYLFYLSGKTTLANQTLTYIKNNFLQKNGDLLSRNGQKSENIAFNKYWGYINGWIALTSQKMGRFDVGYPAYSYLKSFYNTDLGGFKTHKPEENNQVMDVLTTAHLGLTSLYFGDIEKAKTAGIFLKKVLDIQPDLTTKFYLRVDEKEQLITDFSEEMSVFHCVNAIEPHQAYFMIGYPIAFLGKLYLATQNNHYLETAKKYLDFAQQCSPYIHTFYFSHKVAWGASIIANITQESKYRNLAIDIADYLVSLQNKEGMWLKDEPSFTSFDQTAEIAIWLREISTELKLIDRI
ncbi:MAG: hypothetical protein QNJ37_00030 [Crocosphaera sp.]|nr:hypothetical protein [Crocosphaera sp.]